LPETKAKSSEALKDKPRKPHSPEHRARISEALKDKPRKPHSSETRARISEALKDKPHKPLTPEHRAQISKMLKRKPRSPETRRKISEAKKGKPRKPHSPETRARISEAQQRRWSERRKQQTGQLARGRKTALTLHLTPAERQTLHAWQRATTIPAGLARRGRIILLLADGMTITAITKAVGISRRFVYKWVQRFLEQGVEGLADKPGRGGRRLGLRPPAVSAPLHNRHVG
jgi:Helix-turn-helix domain/NUMOD3 motif